METIVQFLQPGMVFLARGRRHIIRHACRDGVKRKVTVIGQIAPERTYFEATFEWGETLDIVNLGEVVDTTEPAVTL
jgi:hypothetical protein